MRLQKLLKFCFFEKSRNFDKKFPRADEIKSSALRGKQGKRMLFERRKECDRTENRIREPHSGERKGWDSPASQGGKAGLHRSDGARTVFFCSVVPFFSAMTSHKKQVFAIEGGLFYNRDKSADGFSAQDKGGIGYARDTDTDRGMG